MTNFILKVYFNMTALNPYSEMVLGAVRHIPEKQYLIKVGCKRDIYLCVYKLSRVVRVSLYH